MLFLESRRKKKGEKRKTTIICEQNERDELKSTLHGDAGKFKLTLERIILSVTRNSVKFMNDDS